MLCVRELFATYNNVKLKSAQRDAKPARWLLHIDAETILSI